MRKLLVLPAVGLALVAPGAASAQVYPPAADPAVSSPTPTVPGAPVVTPGSATPLDGVAGSVSVSADPTTVTVEIENLDPATPVAVVARIPQGRSVSLAAPVADLPPEQVAQVLAQAPYQVSGVRTVEGGFEPETFTTAPGIELFPGSSAASSYVTESTSFKAFEFSFSGRVPGSPFSMWVQSDPLMLLQGTVGSDGSVSGTAYLPGGLPAGEHRFSVVSDVVLGSLDASSGSVSGQVGLSDEQKELLGDCGDYAMVISGATTDGTPVSSTVNVSAGCAQSGPSSPTPGVLPNSGSDSNQIGLIAAVLIAVGAGGLLWVRRLGRRPSPQDS